VFHRGADHYVGLDVGLRQDIQWGYDWLGHGTLLDAQTANRRAVGPHGPGTLQRLPAITFGWMPTTLLGPLRFSVEGEAARLAPLFSLTGDEGRASHEGLIEPVAFNVAVDRMFAPSAGITLRDGVGNWRWDDGEREARDRLMVLPRLSLAAQPGGVISTGLSAAWRQFAWAGEASGRTWSRGYLLLGGFLETEVSRSFDGGALRHVIQPRAEVRAVPVGIDGSAGSALAPKKDLVAYDQLDAAVPNLKPRFQGVLELRQRLMGRGGVEHLRLDVGQGFELSGDDYSKLSSTLGESFARVAGRVGLFSAAGQLRLDPRVDAVGTPLTPGFITRVGGRIDLDDYRGHGAFVTYENLMMEGTARSRQPLDLLFLIDRGYTSTTRVQQLTFGARWDFGPVGLRYEAMVSEQRPLGPIFQGHGTPQLLFQQQTASRSPRPNCCTPESPFPRSVSACRWLDSATSAPGNRPSSLDDPRACFDNAASFSLDMHRELKRMRMRLFVVLAVGVLSACGSTGPSVMEFVEVVPAQPKIGDVATVRFRLLDSRGVPLAGSNVDFKLQAMPRRRSSPARASIR
jgi:LPS-assembly protein